MKIIEQEGGGFHPLVPGHYGAFRALLDDNGQVVQVVPYGQPFVVEQPVAPAAEQQADTQELPVVSVENV